MIERRSGDQIVAKLGEAVQPDSVLCTDDFSAYAKLAEKLHDYAPASSARRKTTG